MSVTTLKNGSHQVVCKRGKAFVGAIRYFTFPAHAKDEAHRYDEWLTNQLAMGIVPDVLKEEPKRRGGDMRKQVTSLTQEPVAPAAPVVTPRVVAPAPTKPTPLNQNKTAVRFLHIINQYCAARRVSASDKKLYSLMIAETGNPQFGEMTLQWAERLVASYKDEKRHLAPSSIRKRVGALTRAMDWYQSQIETPFPISFGTQLGRGYSHYPNHEKVDVQRERLYRPGEEQKVVDVLDGSSPNGKSLLAYHADLSSPALKSLYLTISNTGMRLKEAYWLRVEQIDFTTGLIQVDGTKGHYGAIKKRHVPMTKIVRETLTAAIAGKHPEQLVFPFWDGDQATHPKTSAYLSQLFGRLFAFAGVDDMREHDLRHVATVRWVSLRHDGRWLFSESELMQMMGWSSRAMLDRYIKGYRADDLASRLAVLG